MTTFTTRPYSRSVLFHPTILKAQHLCWLRCAVFTPPCFAICLYLSRFLRSQRRPFFSQQSARSLFPGRIEQQLL
ncbi:hypothetical protein N431DRAFT_237520 [Stipitochalara longipes BDJ]|nr:hypothetical protein N431DRAFT_237520 [Stipitochalara longipes BDJ]